MGFWFITEDNAKFHLNCEAKSIFCYKCQIEWNEFKTFISSNNTIKNQLLFQVRSLKRWTCQPAWTSKVYNFCQFLNYLSQWKELKLCSFWLSKLRWAKHLSNPVLLIVFQDSAGLCDFTELFCGFWFMCSSFRSLIHFMSIVEVITMSVTCVAWGKHVE